MTKKENVFIFLLAVCWGAAFGLEGSLTDSLAQHYNNYGPGRELLHVDDDSSSKEDKGKDSSHMEKVMCHCFIRILCIS